MQKSFNYIELQRAHHRTEPSPGGPQTLQCIEKEQMPYADFTKELGTMTNSGRSEKHNTSNVKKHIQPPSKGKKLDLGRNTAT